MDYFTILNLEREPFSNSPDPDFFFQSRQHVDCLQKLELARRLKRGLNVVIGSVGAGKTTLCRTLLKKFSADRSIESHLVLDPSFNSPADFLETICSMIVGETVSGDDTQQHKERIKHHLFQKGVDESKTVILVIDEGQKLPVFCLEILREFLNYETNDHKLLQIVLFAQEEFQEILDRHANLADRVNLIHFLGPMSFADTGEMIKFRIRHASSAPRPPKLFTGLALRAIYRATGGYPRKIINLCHQCMLALIVQNRTRIGWRLVRSCINRSLAQQPGPRRPSWSLFFLVPAVSVAIVLFFLAAPGWLPSTFWPAEGHRLSAMPGERQPLKADADSNSIDDTPAPPGKQMTAASHTDADRPIDETGAATGNMSPGLTSTPAVMPDPTPEIATSAPTAAEKPDAGAPSPPSLLGALTVKKNDTLGLMVNVVYGDFRDRTLKTVLTANPHIRNADTIRVGDTVAFPAISIPFKPPSYPLWWLKVGEADSLEKAFQAVKAVENRSVPLIRMLATWDPQARLKYGLFVSGFFFNASTAETMMAAMPDDFPGTAEIISEWPAETIFYADPMAGKGY
jgi:general secretion pathway protein A